MSTNPVMNCGAGAASESVGVSLPVPKVICTFHVDADVVAPSLSVTESSPLPLRQLRVPPGEKARVTLPLQSLATTAPVAP
ncbi:MAG TPA: hypothetical protein VFE78_13415 [Gemmataceae bacterium]|nr:hypothetical protein [Gemmataceae bacterium]